MNCPNCNLEMKVEKETGYMKQYKCTICRRMETMWTVSPTVNCTT